MKPESAKPESTRAEGKPERKAVQAEPIPAATRQEVRIDNVEPDPENRSVAEDERFEGLVDSIRVLGVLQALQVQERPGRGYLLIDGERRWRAARKAGLTMVPCDVWPRDAHPRDLAVAGVALNEHRDDPSCLHVARRLRQIKNQFAETHEEVARRTGLPLERVKGYLSLFKASDELLRFFDDEAVSLAVAVEFFRYEKAAGEAAARQLARKFAAAPMTQREIAALRKRRDERDHGAEAKQSPKGTRAPRPLSVWLDAAFRRDARAALTELEVAVARLGYRLVPSEEEKV